MLLVKASFLAHVGGSCFLFNSAFLIPKLIVCNCGSLELWLYHLAKAESNSYLKWGLNKLKEMKFELDLTELSYFLKAGWPCLAGMIKQYFIEHQISYPVSHYCESLQSLLKLLPWRSTLMTTNGSGSVCISVNILQGSYL